MKFKKGIVRITILMALSSHGLTRSRQVGVEMTFVIATLTGNFLRAPAHGTSEQGTENDVESIIGGAL